MPDMLSACRNVGDNTTLNCHPLETPAPSDPIRLQGEYSCDEAFHLCYIKAVRPCDSTCAHLHCG